MIASSVTLLEERTRVMRFSEPYFTAAQFLVVKSGRSAVQRITDLAGEEVGAQIGTTGSRMVRNTPGVGLRAYDDLGLAVEDLAQGRLGGIVADAAIVEYFVLSNERYGDLLRVAGPAYTVEEYAFAIRMDEGELQTMVNRGLAAVRADGTLEKLHEFWFPGLAGQE
jgi:polar amino acid transport system substrate-binding protein